MPNWCENDLCVKGSFEDLQVFKQYVASDRSPLDFNNIIPYPEEYAAADKATEIWDKIQRENGKEFDWSNRPKDGFNAGGYDWCVNNWGTKWWASDVNRTESNKDIWYSFDTAWSPPEPVITKLIEKFPNLKFNLKYYERGCGFRGVIAGAKGKITKSITYKYSGKRGG